MGSSEDQSSIANQVSHSTIDLDRALGEVGNLTLLLGIAVVAQQNDTLDLLLDVTAQP